jgi:hypothetical protein
MSTAAEKNVLVEHRVKALANVFLMGRNTIATYTFPDFGDIDLLARYLPAAGEQEKLFGVILKGTPNPLNSEQEAAGFLNQWAKARKRVQYLPFPVLILAFSMVNDEGYYAWRLEPVVKLGDPLLRLNRSFKAHKTTRKGLDTITDEIDGWYLGQSRRVLE